MNTSLQTAGIFNFFCHPVLLVSIVSRPVFYAFSTHSKYMCIRTKEINKFIFEINDKVNTILYDLKISNRSKKCYFVHNYFFHLSYNNSFTVCDTFPVLSSVSWSHQCTHNVTYCFLNRLENPCFINLLTWHLLRSERIILASIPT